MTTIGGKDQFSYKAKNMEAEAHDQEEFEHCEHVDILANYCNKCKIFVCEDCSMEHLEHLEHIDAWDTLIKEYLVRCKNCDHRLRIFLNSLQSADAYRSEIMFKIDTCFDDLHKRIDEHKIQVKKDIWEKLPKELTTKQDSMAEGKSKCKPEEIKKSLADLQRVMDDMAKWQKEDQKKEMLDILKEDVLKKVENTKFDIDMKTLATPSVENHDFWIKHKLSEYEKFLPYIESDPDIQRPKRSKSKNVTGEYFWFVDRKGIKQRIWRKIDKDQSAKSYSYCAPTLLPTTFTVTFKVNNFVRDTFGVFGVSGSKFGGKHGWLTWAPDQFGFCTDGYGHSFEEGGRGGGRGYVNEEMQKDLIDNLMRGTKKDDMFQMALNRDRTLSMRHNGKQMVNIFHGITGPLYLCASMYYDNSEVEIVEVIDTTQDEEQYKNLGFGTITLIYSY